MNNCVFERSAQRLIIKYTGNKCKQNYIRFSFRSESISQPIIGKNARFFRQLSLPLSLSFSALFLLSLSHPNGRLNLSHYSGASRILTKAMRHHSFMGAHVFTRLFHLLLGEEIDRRFCIWPPHMSMGSKKRVLAENDQTVMVNIRQKNCEIGIYTSMLYRNQFFFPYCFELKKFLDQNMLQGNEKVEVYYG